MLSRPHALPVPRLHLSPICLLALLLGYLSHLVQANFSAWPSQIQQGKLCDSLESFTLHDGYNFAASMQTTVRTELSNNLQQCLHWCLQNRSCRAVNYDGHRCQQIEGTAGQLVRFDGTRQVFSIYAEKICITDKHRKCNDRPWAFEHVLGHHLTASSEKLSSEFFHRKQVSNVKSASDCGQLCLDEESFVCRSVQYNAMQHQCLLVSLSRYTLDSSIHDRTETTSRVKFTATEPFADHVHYLENKCISEPRKFCDFRQLVNQSLKTVDSTKSGVNSLGECREWCLASKECRSYLFEANQGICRLSHLSETSTWHIREPYAQVEGTSTYEVATCYNVSIYCEQKLMKVQIETSKLFSGKIYAKSRPKSCVKDVTNRLNFDISLPYIDSPPNGRPGLPQCDTRQNLPGNFANDIIIQHNDKVLTSKDLSLGVYCKFDLQNDSIARIDLKIQGEILTDKLKGTAELPELSLHVVDYQGRDIDEVAIGDMLRVQIRMSDEATYGIFVRNLVARDSFNQTNNITLIDNKGCPVEMKMMREMRTLDLNSKSLESYLEAFTFTGGSLLVIEAEVETCLDKCRPMQCQVATGRSDDHVELVTSYGRRRRRSIVADEDIPISVTMLSKSIQIRAHRSEITAAGTPKPGSAKHRESNRKLPIAHSQAKLKQKWSQSEKLRERRKETPGDLKADLASVAFRVSSTDREYICFEPLNLMLICALSFCVQAVVFSLLFYALLRSKSVISSPCQPQSVPSSRLHSLGSYNFMR